MTFTKRLVNLRTAAIVGSILGLCGTTQAQMWELQQMAAHPAVGSWLGRAVPIPGHTLCPAGAAGCPVPPEIIMLFTVNQDGTFIAIDSNIFKGGNHTTAHGQWVTRGYGIVH